MLCMLCLQTEQKRLIVITDVFFVGRSVGEFCWLGSSVYIFVLIASKQCICGVGSDHILATALSGDSVDASSVVKLS